VGVTGPGTRLDTSRLARIEEETLIRNPSEPRRVDGASRVVSTRVSFKSKRGIMPQFLDPERTTWHITFGTYGTRLHGDDRPTVSRKHNQVGEPFVAPSPELVWSIQQSMRGQAVWLDAAQRSAVQRMLPEVCARGGWHLRVGAAGLPPLNHHVHVLLDAPPRRHGTEIRNWLKRWLSEGLNAAFGKPAGGSWWAQCGSTRAIHDESYLNNAYDYIAGQRGE
jgi:REP element-mobilizing transposase RayT